MPKVSKKNKGALKHEPLEAQIVEQEYGAVRVAPRSKPLSQRSNRKNDYGDEVLDTKMLSKRAARVLLEEARLQREEVEMEADTEAREMLGEAYDEDFEGVNNEVETEADQQKKNRANATKALARLHAQAVKATYKRDSKTNAKLNNDDLEDDVENDSERSTSRYNPAMFSADNDDEDDAIEEGEDYDVENEISSADKDLLDLFLPTTQAAKINLASSVYHSLAEHEKRFAAGGDDMARTIAAHASAVISDEKENEEEEEGRKVGFNVPSRSTLHPVVIKAYKDLGGYMRRYVQGKVPKLLKVIPKLKNWEEVLYYSDVELWSPSAVRVATRFFAATLSPMLAQRFYQLILLPRVQNDIRENGKLNFHLYEALRLSIYKPVAFYKGIILPIAEEGCTIREAIIISSVLSKSTIPAAYSSVALLMLSQMKFTGPAVMFIKALLNKKYALPREVLSGMIKYFDRLSGSEHDFPLIWYNTMLTFVQRYKYELDSNQKDALRKVLRRKPHGAVTDEIRRELVSQTPVDIERMEKMVM